MNVKALTLVELSIVFVILTVLAVISLPRFLINDRPKVAEAVSNLSGLYHAQRMYQLDNGTYTANCALLEVKALNLVFYQAPVCSTSNPLVSMTDIKGTHTITVDDSGEFKCIPIGGFLCSSIIPLLPRM